MTKSTEVKRKKNFPGNFPKNGFFIGFSKIKILGNFGGD
jgi:hypothetical protein